MDKEIEEANAGVRQAQKDVHTEGKGCSKYNDYMVTERAQIGRYTAEHGPAKAVRQCSKLLGRRISETTARTFRSEYV